MLIFLTAILVLSMISPNQGQLTAALSSWMWQAFGWGGLVMPILLGGAGFYLVLWGMEQPPELNWYQVLGGGICFLAFEAIATSLTQAMDNGLYDVWQIARQQMGGGFVGGALSWVSTNLVGPVGGAFLYFLLAIVGVILLSGISRAELGEWLRSLGEPDSAEIPEPRTRSRSRNAIPSNPAPLEETPNLDFDSSFIDDDVLEEAPVMSARETEAQRIEEIRQRHRQMREEAEPEPKPKPRGRRKTKKEPEPVEDKTVPAMIHNPAQGQWDMPSIERYLEKGMTPESAEEKVQEQWYIIEHTLEAFGAPGKVVDVNPGPTVTQFGVEPLYLEARSGRRTKVKVSKIAGLADDLALALAAKSVRIEAPVPGKGYIGIEVPNSNKIVVSLRDIMESPSFARIKSPLRVGLGQDVAGKSISADLAKMPHLLVAGATGTGKSVAVNSMIACLLLQNSPNDLRFVMVDPKRVELTGYNGIPHLAAPVVVDMDRVVGVLQWALREMDARYQSFATIGARNITSYNKKALAQGKDKIPYIVIVIDELADLMMTAPEDTERALARLAQMARATGIHMIIATQRPSVDVVTGLIKANFPARIALAVSSSTDSRVILDSTGAERLLGAGDMLFQKPDAPAPMRMQGCYVSDEELAKLISYWKSARRFRTISAEESVQQKPSSKIAAMPSGDNGLQTRTHQHGRPATEEEKRVILNPTGASATNPAPGQEPARQPIESRRVDAPAKPVRAQPTTPRPEQPPVRTDSNNGIDADAELDLIDPNETIEASVQSDPTPDQPDTVTEFQQPLWDHLIEEEQKKQKAANQVDELWEEAVEFVRKSGKASTSMLQRRFRIGYTRSARIIDAMEDAGIIGPPTGTSKAREVLSA